MRSSSHSADHVRLQAPSCSSGQTPAGAVPSSVPGGSQREEDVELIVVIGPRILGSHQPTCKGNAKYGASKWLKPPRNAGPAGGASEGLCHPQHWNLECIISAWPQSGVWSGSSLATRIPSVSSFCCLRFCLLVCGLFWLGGWVFVFFVCLLVAFGFVFVLCLFVFPWGNLGVAWTERVAVTRAI